MVGWVRHTAVSMQPWISLRRSIARAIAKHLYRTVGSRLFAGDLNVQQLEVRSAVSQPGSGPGPQCGQRRIPAFSLGFNCLSSLGAGGWAGGQGQAEGCVLESFRAPPRLPTGGARPWSTSKPLSHPHLPTQWGQQSSWVPVQGVLGNWNIWTLPLTQQFPPASVSLFKFQNLG